MPKQEKGTFWRVVSFLGGDKDSEDFEDSDEAISRYEFLKSSLVEENDRVVYYRLKPKGYRAGYYQDARRASIVDAEGNIFTTYGSVPKTWDVAKEDEGYARANRQKLGERYRGYRRLENITGNPEVYTWARGVMDNLEEPGQYMDDMQEGKKVLFRVGYCGSKGEVVPKLTLEQARRLHPRWVEHWEKRPWVGKYGYTEALDSLSSEDLESVRSVGNIEAFLQQKDIERVSNFDVPRWSEGLERIIREVEEE